MYIIYRGLSACCLTYSHNTCQGWFTPAADLVRRVLRCLVQGHNQNKRRGKEVSNEERVLLWIPSPGIWTRGARFTSDQGVKGRIRDVFYMHQTPNRFFFYFFFTCRVCELSPLRQLDPPCGSETRGDAKFRDRPRQLEGLRIARRRADPKKRDDPRVVTFRRLITIKPSASRHSVTGTLCPILWGIGTL